MDEILSSIANIPTPTIKCHTKHNVNNEERKAIDGLKRRTRLIIKKADKGASVVLMDKEFYIERTLEIISDTSAYEKIHADADNKLVKSISNLVLRYNSELTENKIKFLTCFEHKTSNLYCLPKIHKSVQIWMQLKTSNPNWLQCVPRMI